VRLRSLGAPWAVDGLALVDSRDASFQTLVPGAYRLIHSGDVKIYENLDVLPRAFLVYRWQWQPDGEQSVQAMGAAGFNPHEEAVLAGSGEPASGSAAENRATITRYEAEAASLDVETEAPGLLVLTDAAYPGWVAAINGEPATIYQVDGLFRGVMLPAGRYQVEFRYEPASLRWGALITTGAVVVWLLLLTAGTARRKPPADTPKS
jgi:hypothetical protein